MLSFFICCCIGIFIVMIVIIIMVLLALQEFYGLMFLNVSLRGTRGNVITHDLLLGLLEVERPSNLENIVK